MPNDQVRKLDSVGLKDLIADLQEAQNAFEQAKVNIAIIGESGHGKSTLINAIFGRTVAEEGIVETTSEATPYELKGLTLWDLPGCGTKNHPGATYKRDQDLLAKYDAFVLVTDRTITEDAVELFNALVKAKRAIFLVRTKFDQAMEGSKRKHGGKANEGEVRKELDAYFQKEFGQPVKVYYVASWLPRSYDLPKFIAALNDSLDGLKHDRFAFVAAAYTEEAIQAKRKVATKIVMWHAAGSAADGLIPIPGVGMAADVAIILNMNRMLQDCYGLDQASLNDIEHKLKGGGLAAAKKIAKRLVETLGKEWVLKQLAKFATQETIKEVAKWFPVIGELIAAGIGYQMTASMGHHMIEECERDLRELLKVESEMA